MGHLQHIFQIGTPILVRGSPNGTENHFHFIQHLCQIGSKPQTSCLKIPVYHILQARLINRNDPFFQALYLLFHHIHTSHVHPHLSKTGACHQTDITRAYYCYIHNTIDLNEKSLTGKTVRENWYINKTIQIKNEATTPNDNTT